MSPLTYHFLFSRLNICSLRLLVATDYFIASNVREHNLGSSLLCVHFHRFFLHKLYRQSDRSSFHHWSTGNQSTSATTKRSESRASSRRRAASRTSCRPTLPCTQTRGRWPRPAASPSATAKTSCPKSATSGRRTCRGGCVRSVRASGTASFRIGTGRGRETLRSSIRLRCTRRTRRQTPGFRVRWVPSGRWTRSYWTLLRMHKSGSAFQAAAAHSQISRGI